MRNIVSDENCFIEMNAIVQPLMLYCVCNAAVSLLDRCRKHVSIHSNFRQIRFPMTIRFVCVACAGKRKQTQDSIHRWMRLYVSTNTIGIQRMSNQNVKLC